MEMRSKRRLASEINVVPYIDVMLVLLIIFMVTAPLMTSGVDVDLPETRNTEPRTQNDDPVILTVDKNGLMYLDVGAKQYDEPLEDEEVVSTVAQVVSASPDKSFYVSADRDVPFGPVLRAMDLLKQGGVSKASFSSTQQTDKKR